MRRGLNSRLITVPGRRADQGIINFSYFTAHPVDIGRARGRRVFKFHQPARVSATDASRRSAGVRRDRILRRGCKFVELSNVFSLGC